MENKEVLKTKGRIFDVQRYSIHDGPGIRSIVFLKGCIFECKWCCNPESQSPEIQIMKVQGENKTIGRDVTAEEVLEEVMKDIIYYRRSGGGITLSGGEALLQPEFVSALFQGAKYYGINTALESTGDADFSVIQEKILPYLDLFLMDIKHMNSEKHGLYTGRTNGRILENAKKIAQTGKQLIIRVPVIPGFNDSPEEIYEIAKFSSSLPGVRELHLLPYHRLGEDKYKGLEREYTLQGIVPPDEAHMNLLKAAAEKVNLKVQIGG